MIIAPPIVPGIPAANSNPVKELSLAKAAILEFIAPASAYILFSSSKCISANLSVEIIAPSKPLSETSRLLPFPKIK